MTAWVFYAFTFSCVNIENIFCVNIEIIFEYFCSSVVCVCHEPLSGNLHNFFGTGLQNPPLFGLKLAYFYVIDVADSEYDLGLFSTALVSEIFEFTTFWNMHEVDQDVVVMCTLVKIVLMFLRVIRVNECFEGFSMVFVILIWRNSNSFETRAVLNKPRSDLIT